jgi:D-amino-acid dehydrogenase
MRVAVIGAGIVGVTTAYELAADGHEVVVFERHAAAAAGTSFANAGVVAPGYVTPWAAPGMPAKVVGQLFGRHAAVRFGGWNALAATPWMWRWWRNCRTDAYAVNRSRLHALARYSRERLHRLSASLDIDYERADGVTVLLRGARELAQAQSGLGLLRELGVPHQLLDAEQCRRAEPGLNPETALHAAIRLPDDEVGNCRLFALRLKDEAQRRGAAMRFGHDVLGLAPGRPARLRWRPTAGGRDTEENFDAVIVCAGALANRLLAPLDLRLPMIPVHGYSVTAPLRAGEGLPPAGPRGALMDEKYKVAISRIGQRVRVAGSAEIGGCAETMNRAALATLHRVLDDWFPGAARIAQAQTWKGARPMLPDGPPVVGATRADGVWLNVGHGSSGWALACGSARVLADRLAGRAPDIDADGLAPSRFGR